MNNGNTKILVGSTNPVKIRAARRSFAHYFFDPWVEASSVDSGVSEQPVGDEIFVGAKNRCLNLLENRSKDGILVDYVVGIESGVMKINQSWFNFDCACVADINGVFSYGLSPAYCLNDSITQCLLNGEELGDVIDRMYGTSDIKRQGGAIALFSQGVTSREEHCYQAVLMALIFFLNRS